MGRRKTLRIACVQLSAGRDWQKNLRRCLKLVKTALRHRPQIIALPENFLARGSAGDLGKLAQTAGPAALKIFCRLARKSRTAFLLGSVIENAPRRNRFYNTSVYISETGRIAARYRKIHLFDIGLKKLAVKESRHIMSGARVVTGRAAGVKAGFSVCYDLRFPELFRRFAAADCRVIFVPSNFTRRTGQAHWEILLRARAIENQAFVIAPAQTGTNPDTGVASFGCSLILDPWGRVLARASRQRSEVIWADLDLAYQERLRREFPVLQHRRLSS